MFDRFVSQQFPLWVTLFFLHVTAASFIPIYYSTGSALLSSALSAAFSLFRASSPHPHPGGAAAPAVHRETADHLTAAHGPLVVHRSHFGNPWSNAYCFAVPLANHTTPMAHKHRADFDLETKMNCEKRPNRISQNPKRNKRLCLLIRHQGSVFIAHRM